MINLEVTPLTPTTELYKYRMDLEDELMTEYLTPRQTERIQKKLGYISFELGMKEQEANINA